VRVPFIINKYHTFPTAIIECPFLYSLNYAEMIYTFLFVFAGKFVMFLSYSLAQVAITDIKTENKIKKKEALPSVFFLL
jgi:hypothetical protein